MVDAQAAIRDAANVIVEAADESALARYRAFAGQRVKGAAQHPLWYETWLRRTSQRGFLLWFMEGERALACLPLVEARQAGLPVLQFAGGGHANGNFCPAIDLDVQISQEEIAAAINVAAPHISLISLERQHDALAGQPNLLAALATRRSPNIALAVDLHGGFQSVLERANGKKKSKKRRAQLRRFAEIGTTELGKPATIENINATLDNFFRMKQVRFSKAGIADVFADQDIRDFWRDLFAGSLNEPDQPFSIETLNVGGKIRAISGLTHLHDRTVCEFGAIAEDELTSISPGEFLAYTMIEEASAKDLGYFDFSVGDESYKRSWCDVEIHHFDVIIPLSAKGRLAVVASNLISRAKMQVKSNPHIWRIAKAIRRLR